MSELEKIKTPYPKDKDAQLGDGLKVTKEQLFDKTGRDWVYQVEKIDS